MKLYQNISFEDIYLVISDIIINVISHNTPYKWIATEEPFYNLIGRISYDYSGIVEKMIIDDLRLLANNYKPDDYHLSKLDYLLSNIYINSWNATYTSNYGKQWLNYNDLVEDLYRSWKYENFDIFDDDGEYIIIDNEDMEQLDIELDNIFRTFLKETSPDLYLSRISKQLQHST